MQTLISLLVHILRHEQEHLSLQLEDIFSLPLGVRRLFTSNITLKKYLLQPILCSSYSCRLPRLARCLAISAPVPRSATTHETYRVDIVAKKRVQLMGPNH